MAKRMIHLVAADPSIARKVQRKLNEAGFGCKIHRSVEAAANSAAPGLVLVEDQGDLVETMFAAMREFARFHCIVAFAAQCCAHRVIDVTRLGATDYLQVPIDVDLMRARLQLAIDLGILQAKEQTETALAQKLVAKLSPREREVLDQFIPGRTNREVAKILKISHRTVEIHKGHITKKFAVKRFSAAVRIGLQAIG